MSLFIDWDYWNAQLEGHEALKKKRKIWRDHKNETREIIDELFKWYDTLTNKQLLEILMTDEHYGICWCKKEQE